MADSSGGFLVQYRQALVTAVVMFVLFVVVYYLLPPATVPFLYKTGG